MSNTSTISAMRFMVAGCLLLLATTVHSAGYDPLALSAQFPARFVDLSFKDSARNREIPIRVFLPEAITAAPVVLFSHGLGGSREGSNYLGRHWAGRGYVVTFLQHPGSDSAVWQEAPFAQQIRALQEAASGANFIHRVRDVSAVLDQLTQWNRLAGHVLADRLDMTNVGMSGHSFGAITTQAVSGQRTAGGRAQFTDARIGAALIMSPSSTGGVSTQDAFGRIALPWMLMTGTRDIALVGNVDLQSRLGVFPALPPGGKYELVLFDAEHSAFADRALAGDRIPRNPNHHRAILALSTAFWDAHLRKDSAAKEWLDGDGPRLVLERRDAWQRK